MTISFKAKFRIGTTCILLFFCAGASLLEYYFLKHEASAAFYRKTEIYMAAAKATRSYVKDVLRPRMQRLVAKDDFILEAMSTSFISREIMKRVQSSFPEFRYKRPAANPRNLLNKADEFELDMLEWFQANKKIKQWSGVITKGSNSYYARFIPIIMEAECMVCHGRAEDAPIPLKETYGDHAGFGYEIGDVAGADTIYIPMDYSNIKIKEKAWWIFIIGTGSLFMLLLLFYMLFNSTIIRQLKKILVDFKRITGDSNLLSFDENIRTPDEVEQIRDAFKNAAKDLKKVHSDLKISEFKYRRLFESAPDVIFITDEEKLTDLNEAGIRLFGFKDLSEALSTESFYQMFWDGREASRLFNTLRQQQVVRDYEISIVNRSGVRMEALISASVTLDENGSFSGVEGVLRDITKKKRMDRYLAQTEKLASIGQLAAGVAHEINNPLGVIKCYADLIEKEAENHPQIREDISIIRKHTSSCRTIVNSLLNFAKASESNFTTNDIHAILDEIVTVLDRQTKSGAIEVCRDYSDDIPEIRIDEQKIRQVFINLFINAVQASEEGGKITLRTETGSDSGHILIHFIDTGSGISKKNSDRIFEPFFTTKGPGKGTGLGLAVSYGIIKQHDGEIEVKSTPGKGTCFTVKLPVS